MKSLGSRDDVNNKMENGERKGRLKFILMLRKRKSIVAILSVIICYADAAGCGGVLVLVSTKRKSAGLSRGELNVRWHNRKGMAHTKHKSRR